MRHCRRIYGYNDSNRAVIIAEHANKTEYATESGREASMNFESRNPATGELLGVYREHDKAETDARLQRAWDGWRHWSRTPLHERIAFLTRLAELLAKRTESYGRLNTAGMGKPLADSIFEIKKCAWDARHLAEAGEAYLKPQPVAGLSAQIMYESVGPSSPFSRGTY